MDSGFVLYKKVWINDLPPHLHMKLSKKEYSSLLSKGGYFLRNDYDFDTKVITTFWYIIKDDFKGLEELSTKVRNQVRKSLKTFDFRRISSEEMTEMGYNVMISALKNYKIKADYITEEEYKRLIKGKMQDKYLHYWGCFDKTSGELIAFSINAFKHDSCMYNTMKALPEYLHNSTYPYYGLIFEMNKYYLQEQKAKYVCDGARSITEHSNIQNFLENKFGFRKAYCQLAIIYQWWMLPFLHILYPFRSMISNLKIRSILKMEAMRRGVV